jgi:PAS domain S-box-containing protein
VTARRGAVLLMAASIVPAALMLPLDGRAEASVSALAWTLGAAAAVLSMRHTSQRLKGESARPWRFLWVAAAVWLAGQLSWDLYLLVGSTPGVPSPADVAWLAFPLLAALGVHRLTVPPASLAGVMRLDAIAITVGIASLCASALWTGVLNSTLPPAGTAVAAAYPLLYLVGFAVMLYTVATSAHAGRRPGLLLALVGLGIEALAFALWSPKLLAGTYGQGDHLTDLLWLAGMLLLAAGGLVARQVPDTRTTERMLGARAVALGILLVALLCVVVVSALAERPLGARLAGFAGLAVVGGILIARQWILSRTLLAAERAAKERVSRFFRVAVDLHAAIRDGVFVEVNPALMDVLGYEPHEILGRPLLSRVHAADLEETEAHVEQLHAGHSVASASCRYRCSDGSYRWLLWNGVPGDDGLVHLSARDETERKEAAAVLERANRELEAFAYTTSHDLRAPLISIEGFAASLERRYGSLLDDRGRDYISRIQSNANALQRLIDDMLEFARASRERSEVVDADGLAREVVAAISSRVRESGACIEVTTPLPALRVHPARFTQALANLIENALAYARPQGGLQVRISAATRGDLVEIAVEDNGSGVSAQDRERLFDLFARGRAASHHAPTGTGVGLALVKTIAESAGGSARYEETPTGGARFVIAFPKGGSA